jgi:hypothetical protein
MHAGNVGVAEPLLVGFVVESVPVLGIDIGYKNRQGIDNQAKLLLALAKGLFRPLALGDIGIHADPLTDRSIRIENGCGLAENMPILSAGMHHAGFDTIRSHSGECSPPLVCETFTIIGVKHVQPIPSQPLFKSASGVGTPGGRVLYRLPSLIRNPHYLRGNIYQAPEPFLASAQSFLGLIAVGFGIPCPEFTQFADELLSGLFIILHGDSFIDTDLLKIVMNRN